LIAKSFSCNKRAEYLPVYIAYISSLNVTLNPPHHCVELIGMKGNPIELLIAKSFSCNKRAEYLPVYIAYCVELIV